jgi:hypothetical protein
MQVIIGGDAYWRQTSARIDIRQERGLEDGDLLATSSLDAQVRKYGEHYYCGHRADLMASLLEAIPPECVRTGSRVVGFEQTRSGGIRSLCPPPDQLACGRERDRLAARQRPRHPLAGPAGSHGRAGPRRGG